MTVLGVFNFKNNKLSLKVREKMGTVNKEIDEFDNRTTFIEDEELFSDKKYLKRKADKVKGINFVSLPFLLRRDCEVKFAHINLLLHYLIAFLVIVLAGWVYKLKLIPVLVLCCTYLIFGPSLVYFHYRKKYEKKKFSDCVRYIEQMLYSFTRKSKIITALEESRLVIDGDTGKAIDFAINKLRHGSAEADSTIYETALKEIEAVLPCSRVKNLHEFLSEVENVGGQHTTALDIMLNDLREWDIRTTQFQQNQSIKGTGMLVSVLMSLGTCWFMSNILPADMGGDISGFGLYQVLTTISIIVMFFIYRMAARKLTRSWIIDDVEIDPDIINQDCESIKKYYDEKQGVKPVFALFRIQKELTKKFPRWVLRFALLASTRAIPAALRDSIASCPNIMRAELEKLTKAIDENPTGIEPYLDFFGYFEKKDLTQIRSMMLMVYSLSEYGSTEIDKHVLSIVKRNYALQAEAEKIQDDERLAKFSLFTTIPMIIACVVMMIDVAMIVINMINTVSAGM